MGFDYNGLYIEIRHCDVYHFLNELFLLNELCILVNMDATIKASDGVFDAVLMVGRLLGLSRSVAAVFAALYSEDCPLTLDELADVTGLSKSAVSLALRDLIQLGVVQERLFAGVRARHYCGNLDLERAAKDIALEKMRVPLSALRDKLVVLDGSQARLNQARSLLESIESTLVMMQAESRDKNI